MIIDVWHGQNTSIIVKSIKNIIDMAGAINIGRCKYSTSCRQENNWQGFSFVDTNFEGYMIGMVCNHWLMSYYNIR